ncbi:MAG: hypothetical protein ABIG63_10015 [Chloroflexota bacterium]
MDISKPNYVSFMVRLWREEPDKQGWLVQVEYIPNGEKKYFSSVEELFRFIREITEGETDKEINQRRTQL